MEGDELKPLFIHEEDNNEDPDRPDMDPREESNHSGFTFTSCSSVFLGPYLQEMDDLLRSCEDIAGISFDSHLSGESEASERKDSEWETPYFSTSCTETSMDKTELSHRGVDVPLQADLPLTLAGSQLSDTMVEYEGRLLGMLAMLENCMEEVGSDCEADTSQEYVHVKNGSEGNHSQELPYSYERSGEKKVNDTSQSPLRIDSRNLKSGADGFEALRSQMEECIQEVQCLESRRKELLSEVLDLRRQKGPEAEEEKQQVMEDDVLSKVTQLMTLLQKEEEAWREERKREIGSLRSERAEEERRVWKLNLETQEMRDELRKLKRQLFATAKESAHAQAALNKQRHEMELLKRQEENLQNLVLQMTDEGVQLKLTHKQHLLDFQAEIHKHGTNRTSNITQEELCKRHSHGDVQQYLQGSLTALENRYEPMLLALLKRKETTTRSFAKAKDQAQELRTQLRPLRDELQKLELQRACLEEKLKLTHIQRREDAGHYEETIRHLEESSRDLKMELIIQKRKNKKAAEMTDLLSKQILFYRSDSGDKHKFEHKEET
ncbi:syncoilin [Dunckerocampus dactyliophorus]|uniref:syncoilin n=1 Tax=Dunckerocampus dactyliophorus TaxID=161453 RepID=UPI002407044B|nr:syncoilin [Dunckerocampus dactyliophorus]XP_054620727.1 syncoilin [Dunckerocampus dactyliophorus]XP_054620728.1 syncoilin [Dunckerocampus dactyliophorus]XP_054620729.1 syncoilin [Dunckerocampus dactyliophorus]XP_054620730.1 syncoilin [Dunckerocampus dactyliophorus]XP_054620731.1 syncoilin [Dunckerocampus dactyliophorus]XP_054620733.1 syncoilin [Dunckerocampus dactyliophorus]XP_054620734.1 syncoilin [Dunckerocampus dactyliophorus]XP_054620735.1 syncoilin [Dunckerocampus dactyliophorus]XP